MELDKNLLKDFAELSGDKTISPATVKMAKVVYIDDNEYNVVFDENTIADFNFKGIIGSGARLARITRFSCELTPGLIRSQYNVTPAESKLDNCSTYVADDVWNPRSQYVAADNDIFIDLNNNKVLRSDSGKFVEFDKITPCESYIHAALLDRVAVKLENNKATIIADITSPCITTRDLAYLEELIDENL